MDVQRFLQTLSAPSASALREVYAPTARLPIAGQVRAIADLADEQLAALPPQPLFVVERELAPGWFALRQGLVLAIGLQGGQVAWATLAGEVQGWSRERGELEMLAELPYVRGSACGWLEAAYERLVGHDRPTFIVLPEAAFACAGGATCCKVDYTVEVAPGFQAVLDALPELGGVQLALQENGRLQVKENGRSCRFLDAQSRCKVHAALGRQIFPPCALFPFAFAATPDGLAVSTSTICDSARNGSGPALEMRREDLRQRALLAPLAPLATPVFRLRPERVLGWRGFVQAEKALLDLLAESETPLVERLWAGTWLIEEQGLPPEPVPALPEEQRAFVRAFLLPFLEEAGLAGAPAPSPGPYHCEARLTAILRNLLFSKVLSFHFDLATAWSLGITAALVALHAEAAYGSPLPAATYHFLGRAFMHGGGMHFLLGDTEAARANREMLGEPAFARWLLAYVAGSKGSFNEG